MIEITNSLPVLVLLNSLFILALVLSQNESAKDSIVKSGSSSSLNPLEQFTWGSFILQFGLLLIQIKTNNF